MSEIFVFFKERLKNKAYCALLASYVVFCLSSSAYFFASAQIRNGFLSLGYVMIAFAIPLVEYFFRLRCGNLFIFIALLLPVGGLLGTAYDFYTKLPVFDTLLHTHSGFLFACVGFALMKSLLKNDATPRSNLIALIFGFFFSLGIAVLWEMFEYASTQFLGVDMQEDSIVTAIRSYLLAGSHNELVTLENISKTIIVHKDGVYVVEGGYLDLGLFDTLIDMLVCLFGAIVFWLFMSADSLFFHKKASNAIIPTVLSRASIPTQQKISGKEKSE